MADARPLVWLPFDVAELGEVPEGLRYETVVPAPDDLPASVAEVEFYVPAYNLGPDQGEVFSRMPRLRVVQTLTAGVDHIRGRIPDGVLLCNGRGIHNASTAELALTLTLASLRGIPGFVRDQDDERWNQGWRASLADKTVLIVGYGDIGRTSSGGWCRSRWTCSGWPGPPATACTPWPTCRTCCPGPTWWC